ncbi:MAG: 5-formyltetrahydrofolate cyclo-ligase [Gammaproteobacteria bacterium CG11_big_fil_rev_8_21_14_0_20_46_22]|nr:MAG: 5-formyltetrahydrofolate cyclo-ligase [Gammaproteobacteria bacterium CG12_big_fil_rev_8_21_14_0_65_46_12]PIR11492.1 MAG: 5-formyltetrahydrofolate cyclo-ligase [Gammaproteobacteria bacterium CG11_big_fil_rev_8_21_14_0_20_46_22]
MDRDALRQHCKTARAALSQVERDAAAESIHQKLLSLEVYRKAKTIAAYVDYQDEVPTKALLHTMLLHSKRVYLPRITQSVSRQIRFFLYEGDSTLEKNRYGIFEPSLESPEITVDSLDFVIVPLVGFDEQCFRLGTGAGYYDRAFANASTRPFLCGIAFECQRCETVMPEAWDVPVDCVLSNEHVYGDGDAGG